MNFDKIKNIPQELKDINRWVNWSLEDKKGNPAKVLKNPRTGGNAMTNNPDTWNSYGQAVWRVRKGDVAGIGFVFNGDGIAGVDIDGCRDPEAGILTEEAKDIIAILDSYTEISQSGTGVHIICRGKIPEGKRRKGKVEMYETGRYFIMTGNILDDRHSTLEDRSEELAEVHKKYLADKPRRKNIQSAPVLCAANVLEVMDRMQKSRKWCKIQQLLNGDHSGYSSASEAELALMNDLYYFADGDAGIMESIFRQSVFYGRKEHQKNPHKLRLTLNKALETSLGRTYSGDMEQRQRKKESDYRNERKDTETHKDSQELDTGFEQLVEAASAKEVKGIVETDTGYLNIKETKDGFKRIPLTNFIITPVEQITCEDLTELRAIIHHDDKDIPITFDTTDFSGVKEFKNAIMKKVGPAAWFDGQQSELTKIQKLLAKKQIPKIRGVKMSGYTSHDGRFVYVTEKGALDNNGQEINDIALLSSYKAIDNPDILAVEKINADECTKLLANLFSYNAPGVCTLINGYTFALFLRERMWVDMEEKFPHLAVIGGSGSGKSQTAESIILPVLNMKQSEQYAARQATPFTTIRNSSSSNTTPYILNEYKPNKIPAARLDDIAHLLNNSYDRYKADRGQANQSIRTYTYNSPVILVGEAFEPDTSAIERIVRIYLSKAESTKYTSSFINIKGARKLLNKLGRSLLEAAMNVDNVSLTDWNTQNTELCGRHIETSRAAESVAKVLNGIDLFDYVLKSLNIKFDNLDEVKEQAIERFIKDTLDGHSVSKSVVHELLEIIDQAAYSNQIQRECHYSKLERSNEVAIDVKSIYGILERDAKSRGQTLPVSIGEFTRLLVREPYFSAYKNVKLLSPGDTAKGKEARKSYCLNIDLLFENEIELTSLVGNRGDYGDARESQGENETELPIPSLWAVK